MWRRGYPHSGGHFSCEVWELPKHTLLDVFLPRARTSHQHLLETQYGGIGSQASRWPAAPFVPRMAIFWWEHFVAAKHYPWSRHIGRYVRFWTYKFDLMENVASGSSAMNGASCTRPHFIPEVEVKILWSGVYILEGEWILKRCESVVSCEWTNHTHEVLIRCQTRNLAAHNTAREEV